MQTFRVFVNFIQNTAFPSLKMQKVMYNSLFEDETVLAGAFTVFLDRLISVPFSHKPI